MLDTNANKIHVYDYDVTKSYNLGASAGNDWCSLFFMSKELSVEEGYWHTLEIDGDMVINAYKGVLRKSLLNFFEMREIGFEPMKALSQ